MPPKGRLRTFALEFGAPSHTSKKHITGRDARGSDGGVQRAMDAAARMGASEDQAAVARRTKKGRTSRHMRPQ